MMNVLLKLAHGFGTEGMRDCLSLSGMFGSVPGVEQAALDTHKRIIVLRFQESSSVAIDNRDRLWI
ncbi:UNVERIFIED_CONTAM: hypothetical protein NY603_21315, partial [Bacteroidetes bacterium 56_B9]